MDNKAVEIAVDALKAAGLDKTPEEADEEARRIARSPIVNVAPLVRRNQVCPCCASGKKFKHCCGKHLANRGLVRLHKRRDAV